MNSTTKYTISFDFAPLPMRWNGRLRIRFNSTNSDFSNVILPTNFINDTASEYHEDSINMIYNDPNGDFLSGSIELDNIMNPDVNI